MKFEKFKKLWEKHSKEWYENSVIKIDNQEVKIKDYCTIKLDIEQDIYESYEKIKKLVKKIYFDSEEKTVNRFKRAAIISYAIILSEPLIQNEALSEIQFKKMFLKQRLAFYVAVQSIVMEYPESIVNERIKQGPLFDCRIESFGVGDNQSDTFLEVIYKDLYFSEVYKNFNVITMSNVFLLLVERSSQLKGLSKKEIK